MLSLYDTNTIFVSMLYQALFFELRTDFAFSPAADLSPSVSRFLQSSNPKS